MTDKREELLKEWADLCNRVNSGYSIYRDGKNWTMDDVLDRIYQIREEYALISTEEGKE